MNNRFLKRGSIGIALALIVTLTVLGVLSTYFIGRSAQSKQSEVIVDGYQQFIDGDLEDAYQSLTEAKGMFSSTISFYRTIAGEDDYLTKQDLDELILSIALAGAHDDFFDLKPSNEWVTRASEAFNSLEESEEKELFEFFVNNVKVISQICELVKSGETEEALRAFFEVDPEHVASDEDFLVFQVRFFMQAAKEVEEPALLSEARRQLFFVTHEVGIANDRVNQLWVMLTSQ